MTSKISAREFYDKFAPTYDADLMGPKINDRHILEGAELFQKHNSAASGSILDVGCGTGLLKDLLAGNFDYTGIDVSQKMLDIAADRGYKTIHKPAEAALLDLDDRAYDFVFALSSLLFVEDVRAVFEQIDRVARQAIILSLDKVTQEYKKNFVVPVYDHSQVEFPNAHADYFIRGWTSPTTGITVQTRMIYIEKK